MGINAEKFRSSVPVLPVLRQHFSLLKKNSLMLYLLTFLTMKDPTKGKALDMLESSPVLGFDANITGTSRLQ